MSEGELNGRWFERGRIEADYLGPLVPGREATGELIKVI